MISIISRVSFFTPQNMVLYSSIRKREDEIMDRVQIKELSKQQLGGNIFSNRWMMGLLACLIIMIISGVCGMIPGVGVVAAIIIAGPLSYGLSYAFLKTARIGEEIAVGDIFDGFKGDFGGNVLIGLMTAIFTMLWSLLFVIPGIVKSYSYSMAFYIKVDHPEYDWHQCINESKRMMDGHKAELFVLDLSFIGWMLVGMCACGIGILWVEPYMQAARTNFYESIKAENRIEQ